MRDEEGRVGHLFSLWFWLGGQDRICHHQPRQEIQGEKPVWGKAARSRIRVERVYSVWYIWHLICLFSGVFYKAEYYTSEILQLVVWSIKHKDRNNLLRKMACNEKLKLNRFNESSQFYMEKIIFKLIPKKLVMSRSSLIYTCIIARISLQTVYESFTVAHTFCWVQILD